MGDKKTESQQDQLLQKVLDECMEEQLSFVPPEREIARMHTFSAEFLERMRELLRTEGKTAGRKLEKREFVYGFNKIAACILAVLVVGGVSLVGIGLFSPKGSSDSAAPENQSVADMDEKAESTGSTVESETVLEEAVSEEAEPEEGELSSAGEVKTLVNSPCIGRDATEIVVTIGNQTEESVSYKRYMELEVLVDGHWHQVEPVQKPTSEELAEVVSLEPEMAQDELFRLGNYDLDHEAEMYRIVTYVDDEPLYSQFRFSEEDLFGEEEEE